MKEHRKLAAIMFTDIVGYTALMSKDEENALRILRKSRDIIKPLVMQYNGDWHKDTLSSFTNAVDAVSCALEIQRKLKDESDLGLRIGIHVGDVVFGMADGVKVASGIGPLAEPGRICISDQVYYAIRNKPDIKADFMGEKTLENVDRPIKVYALKKAEELQTSEKPTESKTTKPSIAVLPFIDMSPEKDQEYFCDGITEEIINALSHVEDLKVIARTSAFAFKGKQEDIREIGRKLNVETLLEGSVRKAANKLRITAQLINVSDGYHLWSDAYNRELEDVFAIQEEISLAIVDALKVKLLKREKAAIVKRHTENLEAYNLYLKGNYYWQMVTTEGFDKAIECFEQALQKDSHYALANAGLAFVYIACSYYGNVPPKEGYPRVKEYVKSALKIDDTLAEAHVSLGLINMEYDWNFEEAEQEFKQALQLNPNSALTHLYYSFLLTMTERHEKAIAEAKQAQNLDPLSSFINAQVGQAFFFNSQYDRAIEELKMTITMHPNYFLAHLNLGRSYIGTSLIEEAIAEYEKAVDLSDGAPFVLTELAVAYYDSGKKEKADKLLDNLKQRSSHEYVPPSCFYLFHRVRGEYDQSFEWFERACNEHDSFFPWFRVTPNDRNRIPDEPRFKALLKKAGLE